MTYRVETKSFEENFVKNPAERMKGMLDRLLASRTEAILERALDAASLRQQVISNNLANANTPGFKASHVEFEEMLQRALEDGTAPAPGVQLVATHAGHFGVPTARAFGAPADAVAAVQPRVVREDATSARNDGNNVDMERESTSLLSNSLLYTAVVTQINSRFRWLRTAISEGRR